jgi:hypothetical protein
MTKLWLDTEFNGFDGDFISAALVDEYGNYWYQAVACKEPRAWVEQNVLPVIGIKSVTLKALQTSLSTFLSKFEHITIVADWPTDIGHFCDLMSLHTFDGQIMNTPPITFELKTNLNGKFESAIPHNALEDARAMMRLDIASVDSNLDGRNVNAVDGVAKGGQHHG